MKAGGTGETLFTKPSYDLVVNNTGTLRATSAGYGCGTTFALWLPAPAERAGDGEAADSSRR